MKRTIVMALTAAILTGCGGGGQQLAPNEPNPESLRISSEIKRITRGSDTLLMTGYDAESPSPSRNANFLQGINARCQGSVCTSAFPAGSRVRTVRLSDFPTHDNYKLGGDIAGIPWGYGWGTKTDGTATIELVSYGGWMNHGQFWIDFMFFYRGDSSDADNWIGSLVGATSTGNDTGSQPVSG